MRIRLELSEQAHSTVKEEAIRLREENEQLRRELDVLREDTGAPGPLAPGDESPPYGTSRQEAQESLQRRRSWWREFFGLE
jgi:hypothetical protein